ncbi:alpha/beta fold hydrolase [Tengunoibacter tsumagoiensis]|uniref:Alpha/beta hydrolase n=1 Tax=Tengunoibacter tsumagoiensis TaxID=2014871 RepID=A0A402A9G3_9CHLR|nr:alpha/beta hydrolase [Tengunoibacter tsumagoiensis]GCE15824.1 alpha/beta hydrolase [Tengunoibacter tsumagoiensis]
MTTNTDTSSGQYASINGINLYYEIHGTGKPLVMLHGGLGNFAMLAGLAPTLAQDRQVIGVDLYGHGRTALTDRPFDLGQIGDDIAGLIQYLGFEKADIFGYSLGGAVALQTVIRHPERVDKLVVLSTPFKRTGWYPDIQVGMGAISPEYMTGTPLYDAYVAVAPRPEDFSRFIVSMREGMIQDYDWTEQVAALKNPVLIIVGDSDALPPSHAAEFFALLGGGLKDAGWTGEGLIASQLAIVPGATHYNIIDQTNFLLPIMTPFLNSKQA